MKAGRQCVDCTAGRHGLCQNQPQGRRPIHQASALSTGAPHNGGPSSCPPLQCFSSDSEVAVSAVARTSVRKNDTATLTPRTSSVSTRRSDNVSSTTAKVFCMPRLSVRHTSAERQDDVGGNNTTSSPSLFSDTSLSSDMDGDVDTHSLFSDASDSQCLHSTATPWNNFLPSYRSAATRTFSWNGVSGEDFSAELDQAYSEICCWQRNIFAIPSGASGKAFVSEIARLLGAFASSSRLESVALKACMVLPALVLQKPHRNSKSHENAECLTRRMELWKAGDIGGLLHECRAIQRLLSAPANSRRCNQAFDEEDSARRGFTRLMLLGNVKGALRCLAQTTRGGVLPLAAQCGNGQTTLEALKAKHPDAAPTPDDNVLLHGPIDITDPVIFEGIDARFVRGVALNLSGAAGVSGVDSAAWRRMCCSFGGSSTALCAAVASTARRLATEFVDPITIEPLTAGRLIPLDKNPGVRPIGVGEVLRRLIAKAIIRLVRHHIQAAAGALQLCAGQEAGAEAAIHAMNELFDDDQCQGILLVDATNAFNNLNRGVMLHNIRVLCPSISCAVINFYRSPANLYVHGEVVLSLEGTTQGDPLAMPIYAIAVVPIITYLAFDNATVRQVWFADDSAAGGLLRQIRIWWSSLCTLGPQFGYYPNPAKTWLVVKSQFLADARMIFSGTGVQITNEGRPYLGAAIGCEAFRRAYMTNKVQAWCEELQTLARFALADPQSALAALTHGLRHRWTYSMRTTPAEFVDFGPLEDVIVQHLLPAITGLPPPSEATRQLLSLPAKLGGLGVVRPDLIAPLQHVTSLEVSSQLKTAILAQSMAPPEIDVGKIKEAKKRPSCIACIVGQRGTNHFGRIGAKRKTGS